MCRKHSNQNCCCEQPENLKEKPEQCTEEQIRKCHGETKHHSCTERKEKKTK